MSALPLRSDVDLFGYGESVINLDAQTAETAFVFAMTKKELNGSEITGPPVDQGRFRSSERVRAKEGRLQPDRRVGWRASCGRPILWKTVVARLLLFVLSFD